MNIQLNNIRKFEITQDGRTIILSFSEMIELYKNLRYLIPVVKKVVSESK